MHLINESVKKKLPCTSLSSFRTSFRPQDQSTALRFVPSLSDLPVDDEDPTIICQIDFANAFQTPSRQLGTNDCILGIASRTYDQERVQIGEPWPHLKALKNFFPCFRSMNDVASLNRFTDHASLNRFTDRRTSSWGLEAASKATRSR